MDQEQYLRDATHYYCGIEKPLKYGPKIHTLQDLISALYKEFDSSNYVNIEMVHHIMMSYESQSKEWKKFAKFDRFKYTRNLVDAGNGKFNLMILCWGEGHGSAIHDHADSHCFMKMLKGTLVETRFEIPAVDSISSSDKEIKFDIGCHEDTNDEEEHGVLQEIGQRSMHLNEVAYINDNLGLHRVENPSHTDTSVSLHLYCPPFNACSVFQKKGRKITCPVTFWSKYGVREPQTQN